MIEVLAWVLVIGVGVYLLLGALFALPFILRGAGEMDSAAAAGSLGFRLLILPGSVALWPLLLRRWRQSAGSATERSR